MIKSVSHPYTLIIRFTGVKPCVNPCLRVPLGDIPFTPKNGEHEDTAGKNLGELCLFTSRDDAKVWWPWEFLSRPFELLHQSITGVKYASSL